MGKGRFFLKKGCAVLDCFVLCALLFIFSGLVFADNETIEYKIKAGYLYNFTKFITWPENHLETFNLCIVGNDPFGSIIDPIEKRLVKDKPIRLFRTKLMSKLGHCQLVYFSSSLKDKNELAFLLKDTLTIGAAGTSLTVGETLSFVESGGMIAFSLEQGKVKLKINVNVLRESGLEISAKLLEVADIYKGASNE